MTRIKIVVAVVGMLLVAGCGGSDGQLADDPDGREACEQLVVALEHGDDVGVKVEALMSAAVAAGKAETSAIAETVNDPIEGLEDLPTVDIEKLSAACEDAGVDVPDGGGS